MERTWGPILNRRRGWRRFGRRIGERRRSRCSKTCERCESDALGACSTRLGSVQPLVRCVTLQRGRRFCQVTDGVQQCADLGNRDSEREHCNQAAHGSRTGPRAISWPPGSHARILPCPLRTLAFPAIAPLARKNLPELRSEQFAGSPRDKAGQVRCRRSRPCAVVKPRRSALKRHGSQWNRPSRRLHLGQREPCL